MLLNEFGTNDNALQLYLLHALQIDTSSSAVVTREIGYTLLRYSVIIDKLQLSIDVPSQMSNSQTYPSPCTHPRSFIIDSHFTLLLALKLKINFMVILHLVKKKKKKKKCMNTFV